VEHINQLRICQGDLKLENLVLGDWNHRSLVMLVGAASIHIIGEALLQMISKVIDVIVIMRDIIQFVMSE